MTNISTENILKFLQNNLNSPEALAEIDKILGSFENGISTKQVAEFENLLKVIDELLGLDLFTQPDISLTQKEILSQRQIARNNKNWAKSDELRDLLKAHHIEVRDTNNDQLWSRD